MKIMYPENISSLAASNANANFPDENLEDEHPKKLWKGTGQTATITVVSSNSNGLAIFKTNSETLVVAIIVGQTINWDTDISWDTGISWDENPAITYETYQLSGEDEGAGWVEWDTISYNHTITISLDAGAGNIIEAGILSVGIVNSFKDPLIGLNEKLVDYSIVKELNNGAFYVRKRDIVREFSGEFYVLRDDTFYDLMLTILKNKGQNPIPVRVNSGLTNWEWIIYGRITLASGIHSLPEYSKIQFNLLEVL